MKGEVPFVSGPFLASIRTVGRMRTILLEVFGESINKT